MARFFLPIVILLWAHVAWADVVLVDMVARLRVQTQRDGSFAVSLLAGGPLGLGGLAAGRVTTDSTEEALWLSGEGEVSGIQPQPFFPVGEGDVSGIDPSPFAPDGERVLVFEFDSAGDFSGVSPQPFHVFLFTPSGLVGELSFQNVVAESGSLVLSGVVVTDESGAETEIPTFTITTAPEGVPGLPEAGLAVLVAGVGTLGFLALRRRSPRPSDDP